MAKYKAYNYDQLVMIPISLETQLEPGTLEYTINELVENELDLSVFEELNHAKLREHIERVGVLFYERAQQGAAMKKGWQSRNLGELCEVIGGGTPRKDKPAYYSGKIPWATVRDMRQEVP